MNTFPPYLVHIAKAILNGEHREKEIINVLFELGLTKTSYHFVNNDRGHIPGSVNECSVCSCIINTKIENGLSCANELIEYLNKS